MGFGVRLDFERAGGVLEVKGDGQHHGVDRVVPGAVGGGGGDAVVDVAGLAVDEVVGGVEGPLGGVVAEADGEQVEVGVGDEGEKVLSGMAFWPKA